MNRNLYDTSSNETEKQTDMKAMADLLDDLASGKQDFDTVLQSDTMLKAEDMFVATLDSFSGNRTAALWIQYSSMIDFLQIFIRAERTGDWKLHLKCIKDMMCFLAAAGHNLYVNSAYMYLQSMQQLHRTHPDVYAAFTSGHHVIRRSDRCWAGLSSDLVIEQALMRSLKSAGGMTRGRKMGEQQRALWVMSMPACAAMNEAMQSVSNVSFQSSEQHKESTEARQSKDYQDVSKIREFFKERSPITSEETCLRNIVSGVSADASVNADKAKEVGQQIINNLQNKIVIDFTFKRFNQIVTMSSKVNLKVEGDIIDVDSQLLFQRFTTAAGSIFDDPSKIFKYELCGVPSALFESNGLPREAQKSVLADCIWNLGDCGSNRKELDRDVSYVIDGGWLLHRIVWTRDSTYASICSSYVDFVEKRYGKATIVFDSYPNFPTTKDVAHLRRSRGITCREVTFQEDMVCKTKKNIFLSNTVNKQRLINLLGTKLKERGCLVLNARDDADVLIVQTVLSVSRENDVVLIGEDTDLLVLLCYHASMQNKSIFFTTEPKQQGQQIPKMWDIKRTKEVWGENIWRLLLAIHAFSGCDTTSRIFGVGKDTVLKKCLCSESIRNHLSIFLDEPDVETIVNGGKELMSELYNGVPHEGLDLLRYRKFTSKVITGNIYVQVHTLPPTSSSARYHSLRTFFQTNVWSGLNISLCPSDFGWTKQDNMFVPLRGTLPPAPDKLLKIIRCTCKSNCDTRRCSCRKYGLQCTIGCAECKGSSCSICTLSDGADEGEQDL